MSDYERFIGIVHKNLIEKGYDEPKQQRILNKIRDKYRNSPIFYDVKETDSINPLFVDMPNCFGAEGFPEIDDIPRENRVDALRKSYSPCSPFTVAETIETVNERGKFGRTALHEAVIASDRPTISKLLNDGANPYLTDNNGHTPLMLAKFDGHLDLATFLEGIGISR